jgi:endoglucanase Acf2
MHRNQAANRCHRYRRTMAGKQLVILSIIVLASLNLSYGQAVVVGKGSYSTVLPSGAVGPQDFNGANVRPKVSGTFSQPPQSNDFWSSLIYPFFTSPYSNILYAHPINAKAVATGLEIGYTVDHIFVASDFLYPYSAQLTVGVAGLDANQTLTEAYGDWTVTAVWQDGAKQLKATLGHGLPYVQFRLSGGNARLSCAENPQIWYQENEVLGLTIAGKHYGVFAPEGSAWTGSTTLESTLNGKDYLAIALLPDSEIATLDLFRRHAYAFVTNSTVAWEYDETSAEVTATYEYETVLVDSAAGNVNQTMTALYRHQWLNTDDVLTEKNYHSPRGTMKLRAASSFTTSQKFPGILPALPDRGDYNRDLLLDYVQAVAAEALPAGPTYENGKAMARFSHLVHIAEQIGAIEERDYFLSQLRNRLEDWFTVGGEQEYSYNAEWSVLTGYPSGFGADNQINDHHFHTSYAIMSAATIAQYDSAWAAPENWGGMVNLLIKDANNWDRADTRFPFLRSCDAYAGHSWAAGHGDFAEGNNQESSSESMNFAAAVVLWGEATGQTEVRDLGIYLHTTEAAAVDQYWFDVDNVVFPADYPHVAIGMVWGGKGVHSTWFGADPEFIHGINILPVTSGSLYLGRHPQYVLDNYNEVVAERSGQPVIWQDILWQYLALSDASLALSYYYADINYEPFDGESRAHTYHWLYNMKKMGRPDFSIQADIPTYAVFRDGNNDLTYSAYNAGPRERLVTFSDGYSMTVAARTMRTHSTAPTNPDAPVALLFADKTAGKTPLLVQFTGNQSFDPNGLSLSYIWDFGDGDSAFVADPMHTFTETGIYNVRFSVRNESDLTTTDSVAIEVLGNGTPYLGQPVAIPGKVEAEHYDLGGEGIAYHDADAVNWGVPFRSAEGVDIEASNDVGGGYNIGWIEDGEWVEYTIDVLESGTYKIVPYTASVPGGGKLHVEFNGVDLTGLVDVPVTGGWQFWQELDIDPVQLEAGVQVMRVAFHNGQFNLNWVDLRADFTAIDNDVMRPEQWYLAQNYPNPFNPQTRIDFQVQSPGLVEISIYNALGQQMAVLLRQRKNAGLHSVTWDASQFASGVYYYRLKAGDIEMIRKMLLLK